MIVFDELHVGRSLRKTQKRAPFRFTIDRDFRAVITRISTHHTPDAVFTNSDHLQTQTALAADYFGLPAKSWRAAVSRGR